MASGSSSSRAPRSRLRSLDGLRGAAALLVVVHHCLLLFPPLAGVYYAGRRAEDLDPLAHALSYTPLHLVWAGTESVYLFFVLSGIVLALPVLARPGFDWLAYYPRRLVRLYGPVLAAIALAALTYLAAPRSNDPTFGAWVNARPNDYPWQVLPTDLTLVNGSSGRISPLWSLQWEVLFSLLLPLYVLLLLPVRRLDGLRAVVLLGLCAAGAVTDNDALFFLPMFAVGVLTAVNWRAIEVLVTRWAAGRRWFWPVILVLAVLLATARWNATGLGADPPLAKQLAFLAVPGVWLLVVTAAFSPGVRAVCERAFLQWAGRISFSLYLVHEPIVVAAAFLLHGRGGALLVLAVAVPTALVAASLFFRIVEQPSHHLARDLGQRVLARSEGS